MTPKEKAIELVDNYRIVLQIIDTEVGEEILCTLVAKSCAKIAVDEIIKSLGRLNIDILHTGVDYSHLITEVRTNYTSHVMYWNEVKTEISKL